MQKLPVICWHKDTTQTQKAFGIHLSQKTQSTKTASCQTFNFLFFVQKRVFNRLIFWWAFYLFVVWTWGRLYNHHFDSHLWDSRPTHNHLLPPICNDTILCRPLLPLVCFWEYTGILRYILSLCAHPHSQKQPVLYDFLYNLGLLHLCLVTSAEKNISSLCIVLG